MKIVMTECALMQWSPQKQTWYHLGELGSNAEPLSMQGYHTVDMLQLPDPPPYKELVELNEKRKAY